MREVWGFTQWHGVARDEGIVLLKKSQRRLIQTQVNPLTLSRRRLIRTQVKPAIPAMSAMPPTTETTMAAMMPPDILVLELPPSSGGGM